jgi:group I intron endonuclease
MNNYYTYAYLREDGTPYYIGKGKGKRIHDKTRTVNLPPKERRVLLKQNLTEDEAFNHEIYMIAVFGRKDLGTGILYNKTNGGEGLSGKIFTEEHKKKIGEETKKKWNNGCFNEQSYEKWRNAAKGEKNNMYGRTHTDEAREKIRNTHLGRTWSDELKLKKANSMKGENNHFYGKTHTEEVKEKIINRHRKLYKLLTPNGELIEEYCTIRELCRKYNLERNQLSKLISGKKKTYKGWTLYC